MRESIPFLDDAPIRKHYFFSTLLEALRLFEPQVYRKLSGLKGLLTDEDIFSHSLESHREDARKALESLLAETSTHYSEITRNLILKIFPLLKDDHRENDTHKWVRHLRACSKDFFDRYFQLIVPKEDLSQKEVEWFISEVHTQPELVQGFHRYLGSNKIGDLVERLTAHSRDIAAKNPEPFIRSVMDIGDELKYFHWDFFASSEYEKALRLIHETLRQAGDKPSRAALFAHCCRRSIGLALPIRVVHEHKDKDERQVSLYPDFYFLDDSDIECCKNILIERVQSSIDNKKLAKNQHLRNILITTSEWVDSARMHQWVRKITEVQDDLIPLLRAIAEYRLQQEAGKVRYVADIDYMKKFADPKFFQKTIDTIHIANLDEEDRAAITAIAEEIERHQNNG